ncbi:glycoside hydrolase [marine bacterium AO1-C]|nr:glycoside hydrolase [marine bacterium AO1-C]
MLRNIFYALCLGVVVSCNSSDGITQGAITTIPDKAWELVWSDEFDYTGLPDAERWSYDVGGSGWGNQELQYYTEKRTNNARVANGHLIIEAIKEDFGGMKYTSARLVSKTKGDWLYGKVEVKAKLPAGRGTWPAIWMLPTDWQYGGWPDSGEIDIMEHVGYEEGVVHGTVHTKAYHHSINTQKGASIRINDATSEFHVYSMEWTQNEIKTFVDGEAYFTFRNEGGGFAVWPFDKRFHLLLNIAVGGSWGGAQGVDDSIFPQKMEIDYIRVYQLK